jgi:hypothetical protein
VAADEAAAAPEAPLMAELDMVSPSQKAKRLRQRLYVPFVHQR